MKTDPVIFLLYPALGLLAGWLSVSERRPTTAAEDNGTAAREAPTTKTATSRDPGKPWTSDDFLRASLERSASHTKPGFNPLDELLADWTDAEIRAALDASLTDPETLLGAGGNMAPAIFRVYLARDFDAALAWFTALSGIQKGVFTATLVNAWPEEQAAEGLEFVLKNRFLFGGTASPRSIIAKHIAAVSSQGAEAVIALIQRLQSENLIAGFENEKPLAPGFDFAALLASEALRSPDLADMRTRFIAQWRTSDREAAFQWLLETDGPAALLPLTRHSPDMPADMFPWITGKLATFTPAQRTQLLDLKTKEWTMVPGYARRWLDAAQDPAVREDIRTRAAQGLFYGQIPQAVSFTTDLPDDEARVRFIETLAPHGEIGFPRGLGAVDERQLREQLRGWNATPDRIDAIVTRLKTLAAP